jgi:hypothetical protein
LIEHGASPNRNGHRDIQHCRLPSLGLGASAGPNLPDRKSLTFQETTLPELEMVKLKKLKGSKLSSYG